MLPLTGLAPDRPETRERDASERPYAGVLELGGAGPVQPIAWIRDQRRPSCVGQSLAAPIDAVLGAPPWASAVSIWREARRRQGRIEQINEGTRFEYALEGLALRGWDNYRWDEEDDAVEAGLGAPPAGDDLADELDAFDRRAPNMQRWRIVGVGADLPDGVEDAVRNGLGVVIGTGLRQPFFEYRSSPDLKDAILGPEFVGGNSNGHGMRIAGIDWRDGRRVFLLQNSWGVDFGGCHLPNGQWQPGCCWVSEAVIVDAWDLHAFEVRV